MAFRYTGFADEADKTLAGQIAVLARAGWNSIELRALDIGHVCDLTAEQWQQVWGELQAHQIDVAGFGGQVANWARPIDGDFQQDVLEVRRVAPRMRECDARFLRVMSYPNAKEEPLPAPMWRREAVKRLKELATIAEGEGIILGHENCSGYGGLGPEQYLELAAEIDSPAFKLIFDTGNNSSHDQDIEATWRYYEQCKAEIVHVHIKSYKPGPEGKLTTCFPDEDPVQRRILADLKANGYDGYISIEPHLAAAIHAGKEVSDAEAASNIWVEYTQRLETLVNSL